MVTGKFAPVPLLQGTNNYDHTKHHHNIVASAANGFYLTAALGRVYRSKKPSVTPPMLKYTKWPV
jgi:hypothetical protein